MYFEDSCFEQESKISEANIYEVGKNKATHKGGGYTNYWEKRLQQLHFSLRRKEVHMTNVRDLIKVISYFFKKAYLYYDGYLW